MTIRTATLFLHLLVALAVANNVAVAQQIYKWQDEQGVTHFSDAPPAEDSTTFDTVDVDIDGNRRPRDNPYSVIKQANRMTALRITLEQERARKETAYRQRRYEELLLASAEADAYRPDRYDRDDYDDYGYAYPYYPAYRHNPRKRRSRHGTHLTVKHGNAAFEYHYGHSHSKSYPGHRQRGRHRYARGRLVKRSAHGKLVGGAHQRSGFQSSRPRGLRSARVRGGKG